MDPTLCQLLNGLNAYQARQNELEQELADVKAKLASFERLAGELQQKLDDTPSSNSVAPTSFVVEDSFVHDKHT